VAGFIVVGILLLIAAVILYLVSRFNQHSAAALVAADAMPIGDLVTLHEKVAAQVGAGSFAHQVGIQGALECAQPLHAEMSGTPCVAYRSQVEHRREETYQDADADGNVMERTRQGSEQVASNERRTPFAVRDDSGQIAVAPDGADLEMETTVDRFEPGNPGGQVHLGGFHLALGDLGFGEGRRTLGYHYHEEVMPLGRMVYVQGAATDAGGTLSIGKPDVKHARFLVALRSREQLLHSAQRTMTYTRYGAAACGALGLLLVLVGLLVHR
jgi:hypothetical protein